MATTRQVHKKSQVLRMLLNSGVIRHAADDPPYSSDPRYAGRLRNRMPMSSRTHESSIHSIDAGLHGRPRRSWTTTMLDVIDEFRRG